MYTDDNSVSEAGSSHGRGYTSTEKHHPSEFLEFVTVAPNGRPEVRPTQSEDEERPQLDRGDVRRGSITRSNDDLFRGMSVAIPNLRRLSADARAHGTAEHKMTVGEALRLYPKAIAWSLLLTATIVMEGYDLTLVSSFFAFPIFRRTYGESVNADGSNHQISPAWQTGLQNGAIVGEIFGLLMNGFMADRFGYQKTMLFGLVWMCLFVFLSFFAFNIEMLLVSQVLCGIPWGQFQTLSLSYASEVMPLVLRPYLLANVNMAWLIGQITSVGVLRGFIQINSEWSYRIPFGLQWAYAVPILVGVLFAPDSPWWLVRHGRYDEAKKTMGRLTSTKDGQKFNADEAVAALRHTNEVEKFFNSDGMSYRDCFRGTNLRRTEISCMVWMTQALCGLSLTGWAAYYYEQAGLDSHNAFNLSIGMYGLGILGGIVSWVLLPRIGRRRLYLAGLVLMQLLLIAGGICGTILKGRLGAWVLASILVALVGVYDITVGPVCYVLVAEIASTRLRVKTVVIARVAYLIVSIITNVITARALNPTGWDLKGLSNWIYAGTNLLCLVWCYFRLPETFGLSYLELDILFEKKAKTKKFKEFQVNLANSGYFSITRQERSGSIWRGY